MNLRKAMISVLTAGTVAITAVAPASAVTRAVTPSVQEPARLAPIEVRDHHDNGTIIFRNGNRYWHGHRGYWHFRDGYRRHYDGFWYPGAAFGLGIIIQPQPRRIIRSQGGNAHISWCYNRYRSYRAYDNSYQPYGGPRRLCYSPYS